MGVEQNLYFWFFCDHFDRCDRVQVVKKVGVDTGTESRKSLVNDYKWAYVHFSDKKPKLLCFCPEHKNHVVNVKRMEGHGCHDCRSFVLPEHSPFEHEDKNRLVCRRGIDCSSFGGPCESGHWEFKDNFFEEVKLLDKILEETNKVVEDGDGNG